jgi:hypothetical protein
MDEDSSEDNLRRFAVVYNLDFRAPPRHDPSHRPSFVEASEEVVRTATEVEAVLAAHGLETCLVPVDGTLDDILSLLLERNVDTVFNLVESLDNDSSREPELPMLLEEAGIPYTGNPPAALRLAYRKDQARQLLAAHSLPVARCLTVWRPEQATDGKLARLGLPVFVKPARTDASIGIDQGSVFVSRRRLKKRIASLLEQVSGPVLIEEYLPGPEFNVAIFPNPHSGTLSEGFAARGYVRQQVAAGSTGIRSLLQTLFRRDCQTPSERNHSYRLCSVHDSGGHQLRPCRPAARRPGPAHRDRRQPQP